MFKTVKNFSAFMVFLFCFNAVLPPVAALNIDTMQSFASGAFDNIPIYFTEITSEDDVSLQSEVRELIADDIENQACSCGLAVEQSAVLNTGLSEIRVTKVSDDVKSNMAESPLFSTTVNRVNSLIESGVSVSYVNFYVTPTLFNSSANDINAVAETGDPDDPDYWEDICSMLGTYNGYTFLCLDSDIGVSTGWVESDHSSVNWSQLAQATINFALDYLIDNEIITKAATVTGTLADYFSAYTPPISVNFNSETDYEKHRMDGVLTARTVYISDNLDKIEGYAYYAWGAVERATLDLDVDARYPTSDLGTGAYTYEKDLRTIATEHISTYGYWGNTYLFSRVLAKYQLYTYQIHTEYIDLEGAAAEMLI